MPRRFAPLSLSLAGMILGGASFGQVQDSPQLERARQFVKGLRERGFHDLVPVYTDQIRRDPAFPAEARVVLDYEEALTPLEQASTLSDLSRRGQALDRARTAFQAFLKAHEPHPLATEARVQLARILVERGHLAITQAQDTDNPRLVQQRQAEARANYAQARTAYSQAIESLRARYEAFPKFLPADDPRKAQRDQAHLALMNAELQRALVDYEEARTHDLGTDPKSAPQRDQWLNRAAQQFQDIAQRYRQQMVGLHARKWQGKCLEQLGDLGKAMGIYKELMQDRDPRLKALQREVAYYQIIVANKRNEYTAAVDSANAWLRANPGAQGTPERLGVLLERSRALLAQQPNLSKDQERDAFDGLGEVLKYASPLRVEAIKLLAQHRPSSDTPSAIPATLSYSAAMNQANQAINLQDWARAIPVLRAALRAVDPLKDPDRANEARHILAYCCFQAGRYYDAAVLAEHVVRHYPRFAKAPQAAEIALAAWTYAYNNYTLGDRRGDLNRLLDLAQSIQTTFPNTEQEQAARLTLGDAALAQGRYAEAAEAFEGIRAGHSHWLDVQSRAGRARWRLSSQLRDEGKDAEAEEQVRKAVTLFETALRARKDTGVSPTDPGLLNNIADLAEIQLATNQTAQALALLTPATRAAAASTRPEDTATAFHRLMTVQLRANIAAGLTDEAIADMRLLEQSGGEATPLTQLYFELGRLLQKELDTLKAKGSTDKYQQTRLAYAKFLEALVESKSGQSYESLQWAGEAMLALDQIDQATRVFERVLQTFGDDPAFQAADGDNLKLLRTRLKLITARRAKGDSGGFPKALEEVQALVKQHPGALEPYMERCRVLEDWAEAEPSAQRWDTAIAYWKQLATVLNRDKSPHQFEAWYHVAYCQMKRGSKADARRTLKAILTLSPSLNGAEMKRKYQDLLNQLGP
jgi:tetratricopeptide (TPR) repeat protein